MVNGLVSWLCTESFLLRGAVMRVCRKWLLSTVLGAGFLFSAGQGHAAQSIRMLQPDGGWAVSRIAAQANGNNSYCAMARRYGRNIILTIARNDQGETSVAIDFQKEIMSKGQNYNITLDAGHGQERSYDVKPVSGKAVVVRLGQDGFFFDALSRSGGMTASIGGESYNFSMPDIDQGQSDVMGCLADMAEPAAGDNADILVENRIEAETVMPATTSAIPAMPTSVAPPPLPVKEVSARGFPANESVARETEALREENMRLRNALERERRDFENKFMVQANTSSVAAEMGEKVRLMEVENDNLRQQLASVPSSLSAPAPVCPVLDRSAMESMAVELNALRDENSRLKMGAGDELAVLREENTRLRADVESLNFKLAELDSKAAAVLSGTEQAYVQKAENAQMVADIGHLQGRIEVLGAENAGLKQSLAVAQERAASAVQPAAQAQPQAPMTKDMVSIVHLRSIEEELRLVQVERDRLRKKMEGAAADREESVLGSIAGNNWNLEQATRRFNEAEREVRRLAVQLEQQRGQCTAEKKDIEYMLFDPQIAEQEQIAKLHNLEQELAAAKSANNDQELANLRFQVKEKDMELASLRNNLTEVRQQVARAPVAYTAPPLLEQRASIAAAPLPSMPIHQQPIQQQQVQQQEMAARFDASTLAQIAPAAGGAGDYRTEIRQPVAAAVMPAPVRGVTLGVTGIASVTDMGAFLRQAGIDAHGGVNKVNRPTNDFVAYSWDAAGLFGSAEVYAMQGHDKFADLVNRYLSRTEGRCEGTFGAAPVIDSSAGSSVMAQGFEIACISDSVSASASVVFFVKDNQFVAVAHEAPVEGMDVAMDMRDRIFSALMQGHVALR